MMPGGVCAVLDYEVELMAEYVADMAMRITMPNSSVSTAFRKFVSQILTSTRLPSTTILLGMNYLAKRVNTLRAAGSFKTNEGQVWRMLTVSLLLGSKFLDDNTFQNKSWSEVSGLPVQELNAMENEWLRHIDWSLFVNLDKSGDYKAWLSSWKTWETDKKKAQRQQTHAVARERLAPLVTTMRNDMRQSHHPLAYEGWTPEEINDHERHRLSRNSKTFRPREGSWGAPYQNGWATGPTAPLTPPDSGYGTPEHLNSAASVNSRYNEWFNSAVANGYNRGYQSAMTPSHNAFNHYQQPHYYAGYGGRPYWDSGVLDCNCHSCMGTLHKSANCFNQPYAYGQPVMG